MSELMENRTPHGQEATSSGAKKRKKAEAGTSGRGLSTEGTQTRDKKTTRAEAIASPAEDLGAGSRVRNANESGRKILADSAPEEIVTFRQATRADFPLRWPRDSPFEDEADYQAYIERYIGKKFPMTQKKNEAALKYGFRDFVHATCLQLVG